VNSEWLRSDKALSPVSKAEVERRAVAPAEYSAIPAKPDPSALLRALHARGLDEARAKQYLKEILDDRALAESMIFRDANCCEYGWPSFSPEKPSHCDKGLNSRDQ